MVERRPAECWTRACCAAAVAWVVLWSVAHGLASPPTAMQPRGKEHVAGPSGPPAKKSSLAIELIAKVVRFDQAASVDHYGDGRFARYSATTFEIVSPVHLRMRKLVVYHDAPVPQDSPLRALDKKVRFRIQEANLDPAIQLFTGALEGIALQKY
jgi:hypothetical protein